MTDTNLTTDKSRSSYYLRSDAPQSDFEPGDIIRSDTKMYQITVLLGSGGMASVYKGRDMMLGRDVAIKILRESKHSRRAVQEASLLIKLEHPRVVEAYEAFDLPAVAGQCSRRVALVLGLEQGDYLAHLMERGLLTAAPALDIVRQVLCGLAYAHEMKVVHRDVKPENISLCRDPDGTFQSKLFDFGIAKLVGQAKGFTGTSEVLGTPVYMAPEQFTAEPVDGRTDIYAVGVLTYEMITGRVPFRHYESRVVRNMHLAHTPPALARMVPESFHGPWLDRLQSVVSKALAKKPSERFDSAGAMIHALDEVIELLQKSRSPTSAPMYCPRRDREHMTTWATTQS